MTTASSCASERTARDGSLVRTATLNSSLEISPLASVSISLNALTRSPPDCNTAADILPTTSSCHSLHPPFSSTVNRWSHLSYRTPSHDASMSSAETRPETSFCHASLTCRTAARPFAHSKKDTTPVSALSTLL